MSDEKLPLFVFGTLRRGECNHHLLRGRSLRVQPATLPGFARLRPLMIGRRAGANVSGELYHLRAELYERTLRDCDDLEGIPAGETLGPEYRRLRVTVTTPDGAHIAWAYVHRETIDEPSEPAISQRSPAAELRQTDRRLSAENRK